MGQRTLTYQSRPLYCGNDHHTVGELYDFISHCKYYDDAESSRDFDVTIDSDSGRLTADVAVDENEEIQTRQGNEHDGTRTSDTVFTVAGAGWTVDQLIGYRVFAWVDGSEQDGEWFVITDNDATTITITGTLPSSCDKVRIVGLSQFRNNIQLVPQQGMYGTFFQLKVEKLVPTDGRFKIRETILQYIPHPNIAPETIVGLGANSNGWDT